MFRLLPFLCLTFAASPAFAGATAWQDIGLGARARLISSDTLTNGVTRIGLELDLPQNDNTYWRVPGETGIPTQFDFAGSSGVSDVTVRWPYPEIDRSKGFLDYVYRGPVVLPIELEADPVAAISVAVTLGVCADMCVPARANFTLPLAFAAPDPAQSIRLNQAEATTPIPWDRPGEPFGAVTATADGLVIGKPDPMIDANSLIADVGDPGILFETPQKSPDGTLWTVQLLGGAGAKGLEGQVVQLTFMTANGPYAVSRQIAPASH